MHVPLFHWCMLPYYSYMYEGTVIITVHKYKLLDYSKSNSPCRMVAVSTTGSAVCGEGTRFCIETAIKSQKSYKSHLHDATADSSQVILYCNPVTSHVHFNNS